MAALCKIVEKQEFENWIRLDMYTIKSEYVVDYGKNICDDKDRFLQRQVDLSLLDIINKNLARSTTVAKETSELMLLCKNTKIEVKPANDITRQNRIGEMFVKLLDTRNLKTRPEPYPKNFEIFWLPVRDAINLALASFWMLNKAQLIISLINHHDIKSLIKIWREFNADSERRIIDLQSYSDMIRLSYASLISS